MTLALKLSEPLIAVTLDRSPRVYDGGDQLLCEYQIDAVDPDELQVIEASVLWYTEGKGERDLGVHYFDRRTPADADEGDLRVLHRFTSELPPSPMSYEGVILKIRWCVRIRVFLNKGREFVHEVDFQLGNVPPGTAVERWNFASGNPQATGDDDPSSTEE